MPTIRKPKLADLLSRLKPYDEREQGDFDTIKGWDGVTLEAITDSAVLIPIGGEHVWMPLGQLRSTMQDDVYASQWILDKKGLA